MNPFHLSSGRTFVLWSYLVTFEQLLIRSPSEPESEHSTNLDIMFKGVFFVELTPTLWGLEIKEPEPHEIQYFAQKFKLESSPEKKFFILSSGGKRYCVGARAVTIEENRLPLHENHLEVLHP
jgi:hypothetical protein